MTTTVFFVVIGGRLDGKPPRIAGVFLERIDAVRWCLGFNPLNIGSTVHAFVTEAEVAVDMEEAVPA